MKNQLALRHDNDFFLLTDRYYSSGLFLTYTIFLEKGFFSQGQEQLIFSLDQEVFTPSDIETMDIGSMDRPYVGMQSLNFGWAHSVKNSDLTIKLMVGVAGKASGAGKFQQWYHNHIVIADPPLWVHEMENSFHTNLYTSYIYEWKLAPNPFSVYLAVNPKAAFGTRDIYFHNEVTAFFGRRNPLQSSLAYNKLGLINREIFFSFHAGYRLVVHNAMLEGNALKDNSSFLVPSNTRVWYGGFDFQHRYGKNDYWFGYRVNSAEALHNKTHKYIILSYARSF